MIYSGPESGESFEREAVQRRSVRFVWSSEAFFTGLPQSRAGSSGPALGLSSLNLIGLVMPGFCFGARVSDKMFLCTHSNTSTLAHLTPFVHRKIVRTTRHKPVISGKALAMAARKTFVVEHLDPELGPWSALEYKTIAEESAQAGCDFILSSVPETLLHSDALKDVGKNARNDAVEVYFADRKDKICLLDPAAKQELQPGDKGNFDIFLFGGILGDDPPRDRTSELRKKGFTGRRLGPVQMTTDTAVRVTRKVVMEGLELDAIPYTDYPELKLDEHESTEMPFRYVVDNFGRPIVPEGMLDLIKADADKGFDALEFADESEGLGNLKMSG